MGLLSEGNALSWEETHKLGEHVRQHGITQFINLYHKFKGRQGDSLLSGDEIEYMIIQLDEESKAARISMRACELLVELQKEQNSNPEDVESVWHPESTSYMVEGTPGKPYGANLSFLKMVVKNMRLRRAKVAAFLRPDEVIMTVTSFPRLGAADFCNPPLKPSPNRPFDSLFLPREIIFFEHPRFPSFQGNIRLRRGEKVCINVPIFKDTETPSPYTDDAVLAPGVAKDDHVYMDTMAFGTGCCCLQVTFQAPDIHEARILYDQLVPLCPVMLTLTAASPFYRGKITDVDCRWNVVAGAMDSRTRQERGLEPLIDSNFRVPKSPYDSVDCYLSECGANYNDVPVQYEEHIYRRLRDANIDHLLAQHVAHLFIRDPVVLLTEQIHQDDSTDCDHFENMNSSNWQTLRFKPPGRNSSIGWRVEFRPCEVQITDFENAAFVCFITLLTRLILSYKLNFIIPISKVDENMQKGQKRNAISSELFWFRKDIWTYASPTDASSHWKKAGQEYGQMSINHIINGKEGEFPGLIPLINNYLSGMDVDADTHCTIQQYLKLIQRRASGELMTTATYMRSFVQNHPKYQHDSNISQEINYDLLKHMHEVQKGEAMASKLLGCSMKSEEQEMADNGI